MIILPFFALRFGKITEKLKRSTPLPPKRFFHPQIEISTACKFFFDPPPKSELDPPPKKNTPPFWGGGVLIAL